MKNHDPMAHEMPLYGDRLLKFETDMKFQAALAKEPLLHEKIIDLEIDNAVLKAACKILQEEIEQLKQTIITRGI